MKIVFSVPVQSFVCNVKRTGTKRILVVHLLKWIVLQYTFEPNKLLSMAQKCIIQVTNFGLIFNLASFLAK